jgi:pimeloyl-ACP methyl ester carboxylesterase
VLRGLSREARHWGAFPPILQTHLGAPVYALDLPGSGQENARPSPRTIAEIADDVRGRWLPLRDQHPGEPWWLVAISMGGMLALDWCARHPGEIAKVVLINSSAANLSPFHHRMRLPMLARVIVATISSDLEFRERAVIDMTTNRLPDVPGAIAANVAYAQERPMTRQTIVRQMGAAGRFRAPERVDVPVLVAYSEQDRLVDHRCSLRLAEQLGAQKVCHPTAGHDLPLEDPGWLAERVSEFLRPQFSPPMQRQESGSHT